MKKKSMKKLISIMLCALFIMSMSVTAVFAEETANVKKGTAVIDGVIDEIWGYVDELPAVKINPDPGADTGTKGYAKVMWSGNDVYILVVVNDANGVHEPNGGGASANDSIEAYFDLANNKSDGYTNSGEFYFGVFANGDFGGVSYAENTDESALQNCAAVKTTGNQIVYELKIPMKEASNGAVSKIAAGQKMGFDIQINDDADGSAPRDGAFNWSDSENNDWQRTDAFGTLVFTDVEAMPAPAAAAPEEPAAAPEANQPAPEQTTAAAVVISASIAPATGDTEIYVSAFIMFAAVLSVAVITIKTKKTNKRFDI